MLIGFKIKELTDLTRPLAYDFIKSVSFLLEEDLQNILDKWQYVTIYSTEIDSAMLAALPFPVDEVHSSGENMVINNVENKLELPYIDQSGFLQVIKLGITETKSISDFIRLQLLSLEERFIIRYLDGDDGESRFGDFDKEDFDKDDFLTN